MPNSWLEGIRLGSSIASDAMARNERMQQFRSQQTLRRMQERQIAAEMELTLERVEQIKAANALKKRYEADMDVARQNYLFDVDVFSKMAVANRMVPEPEAIHDLAVQRNIEPVLDRYHPEKSSQIRADRARLRSYELRRYLAGQPRPKTSEEIDLIKARTETEQARKEAIERGEGYAPTVTTKDLVGLKKARELGDKDAVAAYERKLGLIGLDEVDRAALSSKLRSIEGKRDYDKLATEIIAEFKAKRDNMSGGESTTKGTRDNPHHPATQADFNAVQPGEYFVNPADGKLYRKGRG